MSQDWLDRLKAVECHDSTYPPESQPFIYDKAQGSLLKAADGQEYIDLCAGFGVLAMGHNPEYSQEIYRQQSSDWAPVVHGMGDVYPSKDKILFLESLLELLPSQLQRAALSLSGAGAVEIALKPAC